MPSLSHVSTRGFHLIKGREWKDKEKITIIIISAGCGESCAKYNKPLISGNTVRQMSKVCHAKRKAGWRLDAQWHKGTRPWATYKLEPHNCPHQGTSNLHDTCKENTFPPSYSLWPMVLDDNVELNKRRHWSTDQIKQSVYKPIFDPWLGICNAKGGLWLYWNFQPHWDQHPKSLTPNVPRSNVLFSTRTDGMELLAVWWSF